MSRDGIVRLPFKGHRRTHQQLAVPCWCDAEFPADQPVDLTPDIGMCGREVEQLRDRRSGHGDSLRAATDTTVTIPRHGGLLRGAPLPGLWDRDAPELVRVRVPRVRTHAPVTVGRQAGRSGRSTRHPRRVMSGARPTLTRMPTRGLDPETALDVRLSAICGRNQYTKDPAPVIDELHQAAGDRLDILARVAGRWAGFYESPYTAPLCTVLLEIPGALDWVALGRARRDAGSHGAPMVRP